MKDIVIVGGGAAGIAAALAASEANPNAQILLLEGLDRVGKKILVTGNGKCNLTNTDLTSAHYHTHAPNRLARWLEQMPPEMTLDFFRTLGLKCMEDDAGRVYPYARQAAMVLDVLRSELSRRKAIQVSCNQKVTDITRKENGFSVLTGTETVSARQIILTTGGKSSPKQGSDGSGYPLVKAMGHHCTPLSPALVPMKCRGNWFSTLKGLRVLCDAALYHGKERVGFEHGEVQFTDYGLSGIPIFQLSCLMTGEDIIVLDLVPEMTYPQLREEMLGRQHSRGGEDTETALLGLLPKRLQFVLLRQAGIDPAKPLGALPRKALEQLCGLYKQWRIEVTGTQGFDNAQVTRGGVVLEEINVDFSSRKVPGLYLAGEILDVTGDCGGYNLHWAWCSGIYAGRAAAERVRRQK